MERIQVRRKSLAEYVPVVGEEAVEEIRKLAAPLAGAHVLHINATSYGGGVAEILSSLVPLMNDIGLHAEWHVIEGSETFFQVTKALHNALQGMEVPWTKEMEELWWRYNRINARRFEGRYDFIVVHDPQPAGILPLYEESHARRGHWIWRCHIDLTAARPEALSFLLPTVQRYDAAVFTLKSYVPSGLEGVPVFVIPPAIDPLSPKNVPLAPETCRDIVASFGVDLGRPIILQVSRFDPWKDPLGVVDVYRMVKSVFPEVQLVYIASMANDDPEGWLYFERTARHAGEDPDIHLLTNVKGVGDVAVNAFQRTAAVVLQKSTREGFGLSITEALWKGRPVVAGNVGGIPLQVIDGETGFLVNNSEEAAERVIALLKDPELGTKLGRAGQEHVRRNFLTTRYLRDYLQMFHALEAGQPQHDGWILDLRRQVARLAGRIATPLLKLAPVRRP